MSELNGFREEPDSERVQNEIVGRYLNGIAHDLNNWLGAILNYAELVRENENLSEEGQFQLDELRHASQLSAELLKAALVAARPDKGKPVRVNVAELLRQAVSLSDFEYRRAGGVCRVVKEPAGDPIALIERGPALRLLLLLLAAPLADGGAAPLLIEVEGETRHDALGIRVKGLRSEWPLATRPDAEREFCESFMKRFDIRTERLSPDTLEVTIPLADS